MSLKKNNILRTIGIVVAIAIFLAEMWVHHRSEEQIVESYEAVIEYKDTEKDQLIQDKNLVAQEVISLKQNVVQESIAKDYLKEQFEEFKTVQSHMKAELLSRINSLEIEFDQPVTPESEFKGIAFDTTGLIHKDTISKHFLRLPKTFSIGDQWFAMSGGIGMDKKFKVDSMSLINKLDVTIGYKKPEKKFKFLRKSEPQLTFKSYNPYTSVPYVNNMIVEDDMTKAGKLFNSRAAWFGYGFLANSFITKTLQ